MRRRIRPVWCAALLVSLAVLASCDTADPLPDAPLLQGPIDSTAFDLESAIGLTWFPVSEATSYRVEVSHSHDFATLVDSKRSGNASTTVGPYPKGAYYWRVVPLAPGGAEGRPSGDNLFFVEDRRDLAGSLTWNFTLSGGEAGKFMDAFSEDSGGLPRLLAERGLPPASQVRLLTFRRISIRVVEPEGTLLSDVGSHYQLHLPLDGERGRLAAILYEPDTGDASAEMRMSRPTSRSMQTESAILAVQREAPFDVPVRIEVSALVDLVLAVP